MKETRIQNGYLVLVDLSGYTSFMASSELDHAHAILASLLSLLQSHLTPTLDLAEVEGDALFLYAPGYRMTRGETLLELIESTYVAFQDRKRTMQRAITCPCQACQAVPSLDLKFVTHCGDYVLQAHTGRAKPFGTSVNLAHRLLKNAVTSATGWPAYALFTEEALQKMRARPEGMHMATESYEHLGDCAVGAIDLQRRFSELTADRHAFVGAADAHFTIERRFPVPPARLWEYLNDPDMRGLWEIGSEWSAGPRAMGRTAPGAHNHCANSNFIEEVLDWRPFDYFTVRLARGPFRTQVTGELQPCDDGTALRWSMMLEGRGPRSLCGPVCRFFATKLMRVPERFDRLDRFAVQDQRYAVDVPAVTDGGATGPVTRVPVR